MEAPDWAELRAGVGLLLDHQATMRAAAFISGMATATTNAKPMQSETRRV
jgi:hypothetical protein